MQASIADGLVTDAIDFLAILVDQEDYETRDRCLGLYDYIGGVIEFPAPRFDIRSAIRTKSASDCAFIFSIT